MGLFRNRRELQFRVHSHGKSPSSPYSKVGEIFYTEEKEVGKTINKESMTFHGLSSWQERRMFLIPDGLCHHWVGVCPLVIPGCI